MRDPDFTLAAGPVMASPRVLAALGSPLVYHYDPAFLEAFRRTERKLAQIFLTGNDVLLMQGEAVLGLEAAARGLVQPGSRVLNLVQGVFGKGMGYWLKDFGAELHELEQLVDTFTDLGAGPAAFDHAGLPRRLFRLAEDEAMDGKAERRQCCLENGKDFAIITFKNDEMDSKDTNMGREP